MSDRKTWEKMGELLAQDRYGVADYVPPPPPAYEGLLPEAFIESRGPGRPAAGLSLQAPAAGGEAFISGEYQKRDPREPVAYGARLGWRKKF